VVCLAPRAPGDSVRPRRLSGVVVRPLNFTVSCHATTVALLELSAAFGVCSRGLSHARGMFDNRRNGGRAFPGSKVPEGHN
jgi:hypothetical protein